MPNSHGYNCRTRKVFSRGFRKHGRLPTTPYLRTYRIGQYVDIKVNGAIHKGRAHRNYHGKTGRVWNITPRAVGVEIDKMVRGRYIRKRIHVRIEHVRPSKCRQDYLKRVEEWRQLREAAKKEGKKLVLKRTNALPRAGTTVKVKDDIETLAPIPFEFVF